MADHIIVKEEQMQDDQLTAKADLTRPLRVGIVGCGRIAEHHLKFLVQFQNVDIVGLSDTSISRAKQIAEKYGIKEWYGSLDDLLGSNEIDVLHIVTPPKYHFEQARRAIEKGIHVFIEKPITLSLEETAALFALAEERNVKICPDFIHLFNPIMIDAKAVIRRNALGRLVHAESYMTVDLNDPELREALGLHWSYELPGGVMQNYITHPLYLVFDWIGRYRKITLCAQHFGALPQGLTDHLDILVEGEKANAKITLTNVPKHENYYLKLFFERGTVAVDFITQTFTVESVSGLPRMATRVLTNFIKSRQLMGGSISNVYQFLRKKMIPYQGLRSLLEAFYAYVGRNAPSPISQELVMEVSRAEEEILEMAGKVHFEYTRHVSRQKLVTRKEKILVTGASGYVGSEVVRRLVDDGYYVRAFVRKTSHTQALEDLGVELAYGDIRDAETLKAAVRGMDIIVHIAAGLRGSNSFILDCTVRGTRNVAEAAVEANIKRVIYLSSFSIYDYAEAKDGTVLTEQSQLEKNGELRGVSSLAKRQAEDIALSNISGVGPAWTILRPSLIFGNGRDIASLIGPRIGKLVVSFGSKKKHLKLIHVADVARAIAVSLENDATQNCVFNLSHEDHVTVDDVFRGCFRKSSLKNYRIIYVPFSAGQVGIVVLKAIKKVVGKGPSMNRVRLAYLCRDLMADSGAFREITGWKTQYPLLTQLAKEAENA